MRRKTKTWLRRGTATALLAFALGYIPYHLYARSGLARTMNLRQELAGLRQNNRQIQADISRLERELKALREDPRAIERVARSELGWVRSDEIVFELQPDEAATRP